MKRALNLRQIEAMKAVIEAGTVSNAATLLHVSQPAVSKLLAHLEADTGLRLFERARGRLVPTAQGMRFYQEIDRIFAGIRQVERAVDVIRREEQGQLVVGVLPALSVTFVQRTTAAFLRRRPLVYMKMMEASSFLIVDWLSTRQIDVGLISFEAENPYIDAEPLMRHALVCIMPPDHPLAAKSVIVPEDLDGLPFISFAASSQIRQRLETLFEERGVRPRIVIEASNAPMHCDFVATGLGVSVVHPLFAAGVKSRVAMRRFEPPVPFAFYLCRSRDSRNAELVSEFIQESRTVAEAMSRELLSAP